MQILRQSTEIEVRVGPFMDATDGVTPETGVTLGAADQAELLKTNGAATVDISGATWGQVTGCNGWYDLTLTDSHTDTVGLLTVVVQDADVCLPVFMHFMVIEEAVFDALFAASAAGYSTLDAAGVRSAIGLASANLDTQIGTVTTHLTDVKGTGFAKDTHSLTDILDDVTGLDGDAMRGTDSAAPATTALSTVVWTADRAGYLDKLNVSGTLAHSDAAATYKATGFAVPGDKMDLLDTIMEDA